MYKLLNCLCHQLRENNKDIVLKTHTSVHGKAYTLSWFLVAMNHLAKSKDNYFWFILQALRIVLIQDACNMFYKLLVFN